MAGVPLSRALCGGIDTVQGDCDLCLLLIRRSGGKSMKLTRRQFRRRKTSKGRRALNAFRRPRRRTKIRLPSNSQASTKISCRN